MPTQEKAQAPWFARHAAALVRRPGSSEPVIDGVRALAILWVIAGHSVCFHLWVFPAEVVSIVERLGWLERADLGVDLFFVISGYLIASILMTEHRERGDISLRRFYARRWLRLTPVYIVAMVIGVPLLGTSLEIPGWDRLFGFNVQSLWANLLYINNFLPYGEQYMGWCWSLAVEEQFYLLAAPLLLFGLRRSRGRLVVVLLLLLVSSGLIRLAIIHTFGFTPPFQESPTSDASVERLSTVYDNLYTRYGPLVAGVLGAFFSVYARGALGRFFARHGPVNLCCVVALAVMAVISSTRLGSQMFDAVPQVWGQLWFALHRDVFGVAGMFLILAAIHSGALVPSVLRRFLGLRIFYPIAQISYSLYLVHELWFHWLFPRTGPVFEPMFGARGAMAADAALGLVLSVALSVALYVFIERPTMALRSHPWITRLIGAR